ncbi:hypothetical protein [Segetibacter aerophilus]|uniref:Uncharacterized protein n=1 Tax=Segetibacter aerophilus TaxID=670293 RepID=A0A512B6E3_9BACT|nr:hypothetical protein [Segetibacter aerophilus]GEO07519.1 hypothetical protein SAE01_00150 [Segetibacter aerophilus]
MKSKDARLHYRELNFREYGKEDRYTGVSRYAILDDGIVLVFRDRPAYYLYSFKKPGRVHVINMIEAAIKGEKLSTYINRYVRNSFEDTWPPNSSGRSSSSPPINPIAPFA